MVNIAERTVKVAKRLQKLTFDLRMIFDDDILTAMENRLDVLEVEKVKL